MPRPTTAARCWLRGAVRCEEANISLTSHRDSSPVARRREEELRHPQRAHELGEHLRRQKHTQIIKSAPKEPSRGRRHGRRGMSSYGPRARIVSWCSRESPPKMAVRVIAACATGATATAALHEVGAQCLPHAKWRTCRGRCDTRMYVDMASLAHKPSPRHLTATSPRRCARAIRALADHCRPTQTETMIALATPTTTRRRRRDSSRARPTQRRGRDPRPRRHDAIRHRGAEARRATSRARCVPPPSPRRAIARLRARTRARTARNVAVRRAAPRQRPRRPCRPLRRCESADPTAEWSARRAARRRRT